MPYTPPSQHSPVASKPGSPSISRNHSYSRSLPSAGHEPRPGLPRSSSSASYLHKHRRSPSMPTAPQIWRAHDFDPDSPQDNSIEDPFDTQPRIGGSSVRQSPQPITNESSMPAGAMISPPDSAQNSSDDEDTESRGRTRKLENLAELQAAISIIEQHREGSPDKIKEEIDNAKISLGVQIPSNETHKQTKSSITPAKDFNEARKISHSHSGMDSAIADDRPVAESPSRSSDSDIEEDERRNKPPMLRKKSGELVRPALRPASAKRRPSSMPGTPTYSKAVHFDQKLEHVKHFLQLDKPAAVSANSSPVENYEGEAEFPFGTGHNNKARETPWQWDIKLPNFPRENILRKQQPVHVERVFLSVDCKTLIGTVAVQNLAFHKQVIARFTLDHWKTTSEVTAEYNDDHRRPQDGLDRFNFNIKIEDLANIENRTLFFCVRYAVNGQDYWDSNGLVNFQVNFNKKAIPQHGKNGMQSNATKPLVSLPRSKPSPPAPNGRQRPKSVSSFDDFAQGLESFPPAFPSFNDTPIRFRNKVASAVATNEAEAAPPTLKKKAPSQAFGNRYDFGASLSAAMQTAANALGEKSGLPTRAQVSSSVKPNATNGVSASSSKPQPVAPIAQVPTTNIPKPTALTEGKPDVKSQSYNELIDKYCFFGSSKPTLTLQRKSEDDDKNALDDNSDGSSSDFGSLQNSPEASPPIEQIVSPPLPASPRISRSGSPALAFGSRTGSPAFGYPYHQSHNIFSDAQTPTAIRG